MTNEEKSRAVALELGLWKEGDPCQCRGCIGYEANYHDASVSFPPDFTTSRGANMLLTELSAERGLTVCIGPTYLIIHDRHGMNLSESLTGVHRNWREALLDAAWKLR